CLWLCGPCSFLPLRFPGKIYYTPVGISRPVADWPRRWLAIHSRIPRPRIRPSQGRRPSAALQGFLELHRGLPGSAGRHQAEPRRRVGRAQLRSEPPANSSTASGLRPKKAPNLSRYYFVCTLSAEDEVLQKNTVFYLVRIAPGRGSFPA